MVQENVNLPEIFFYWMQFKDRFNSKVKKNLIPFGMLFTQIMRNARVNVFGMEASAGVTQLKGVTCVKIAIADKFVEYAQKRKEEGKERKQRRNHNPW